MNYPKGYRGTLSTFDNGEWFQFPGKFVSILDGDDAIFLALLINIAALAIDSGRARDFWFVATTPHIMQRLPFSRFKVMRILRKLETQGLISTRIRGWRRVRWIRVHVDVLAQRISDTRPAIVAKAHKGVVIEPCQSAQLAHNAKCAASAHCIKVRAIQKKRSVRPLRGGLRVLSLSNPFHDYGKRLLDAVQAVRNTRKPNLSTWSGHFRRLVETRGVPHESVERVLSWYCATLSAVGDLIVSNEGFIPIAYSAAAFVEKFDRLEAAMHRDSKNARSTKKINARLVVDEDDDESEAGW